MGPTTFTKGILSPAYPERCLSAYSARLAAYQGRELLRGRGGGDEEASPSCLTALTSRSCRGRCGLSTRARPSTRRTSCPLRSARQAGRQAGSSWWQALAGQANGLSISALLSVMDYVTPLLRSGRERTTCLPVRSTCRPSLSPSAPAPRTPTTSSRRAQASGARW